MFLFGALAPIRLYNAWVRWRATRHGGVVLFQQYGLDHGWLLGAVLALIVLIVGIVFVRRRPSSATR
jgi:hypothetical protein